MDATLEKQALEAQATAGQAGVKAFSDAQSAIAASKQQAIESALAEARTRGSSQASMDQIAQTVGAGADRRLNDITQAQATFQADNSRRQQSLTDYFSKVRGGEALIQTEGERDKATIAAKLAADVARMQREGEQNRLTSQMDFENKQKLQELQFAMQQASRAGSGSKKLSADEQLQAIQQAARANLESQAQGYQAQAQKDYQGTMDSAQEINNLATAKLMDIQNQWTPPSSTPTADPGVQALAELVAEQKRLAGSQEPQDILRSRELSAVIKQQQKQGPVDTTGYKGPVAPAPKYNLAQWDAPEAALASKQTAAWDALKQTQSKYDSLFSDPSYLTNEMLRIGQGAGIDQTVLDQLSPQFKIGQSLGDILGIESGQGTLAQQQAAAEKAQRDQLAGQKQASAAETEAIRSEIASTTGRDLTKLASDAKVAEPAAARVISSDPDFTKAVQAVQSDRSIKSRSDLDAWMTKNLTNDPVFNALLRAWFADALPS